MKKYIVLVAFLAFTGCGGSADKDLTETTTEITSETTTEETSETTETTSDEETDLDFEETTSNIIILKPDTPSKPQGEKTTQAQSSSSNFEGSSTYNSLKQLASGAGFDMSYSGNQVVFKKYITDDTIDYIKSKDETYKSKWEENCGLYEEFGSEAIKNVKNGGENVSVVVEIVGSSDNQVYFKSENGTNVYDAYSE